LIKWGGKNGPGVEKKIQQDVAKKGQGDKLPSWKSLERKKILTKKREGD